MLAVLTYGWVSIINNNCTFQRKKFPDTCTYHLHIQNIYESNFIV